MGNFAITIYFSLYIFVTVEGRYLELRRMSMRRLGIITYKIL